MKTIMSFIILLTLTCPAFAQQPAVNDIFQQANKAYEDSQFEQAIAGYETLVSANGISSPEVFYNLGNAYYRTNKIGKAVLWYERALRLSPGNDDIKYNLKFVRSLLKEQDESFLSSLVSYFSFNGLVLFCCLVYFLLMAGIIVSLFYQHRYLKRSNITAAIVLFLSITWAYAKYSVEIKPVLAIVTSSPAEVRSGPSEEYAVGFTLPEGKKVTILGQENNWYTISVRQTQPSQLILKGWIPQSVLEKI